MIGIKSDTLIRMVTLKKVDIRAGSGQCRDEHSRKQGISENTDIFDERLKDTHYQKMRVFHIPNPRTIQGKSLDIIDIIINRVLFP